MDYRVGNREAWNKLSSFTYTFYAEEVLFGVGAVARLGEIADRYGIGRLLLCTTPHARGRGHLDRIALLWVIAWWSSMKVYFRMSHETQVSEAVCLASQHAIDAVIGLGGGSSIGSGQGRRPCSRGASDRTTSPRRLSYRPASYTGDRDSYLPTPDRK